MKKNLTSEWAKAALIRAIKTVAQTLIGMITVGAAISEVNWGYIFSVSVVAGLVSLLTSIGGLPETGVDGTLEYRAEDDPDGDGDCYITVPELAMLKDGDIVRVKVHK